jgi:hypothetical protein
MLYRQDVRMIAPDQVETRGLMTAPDWRPGTQNSATKTCCDKAWRAFTEPGVEFRAPKGNCGENRAFPGLKETLSTTGAVTVRLAERIRYGPRRFVRVSLENGEPFPLHLLVDKDQENELGFHASKSNRLQQRFKETSCFSRKDVQKTQKGTDRRVFGWAVFAANSVA